MAPGADCRGALTSRLQHEGFEATLQEVGRRREADADRDKWFTAEEAKDYGLVDHVIARA